MGKHLQDWLIKLIYILLGLVLLILVFLTNRNFQTTRNYSSEIGKHSSQRTLIEESLDIFKDIEASTRGYLLMGDKMLLTNRNDALIRHQNNEVSLLLSLKGQPEVIENFRRVSNIYHQRMKLLSEGLESSDPQFVESVLKHSADVVNEASVHVEHMASLEDQRIVHLNNLLQKGFRAAPLLMVGLICILVIFLILTYRYLTRQILLARKLSASLNDTNNTLYKTNAALTSAQSLLDSVLKANPNGIMAYETVRDPERNIYDFRVIFATGQLKILATRSPESIVGSLASELYPNLKETDFFKHLKEVITSGRSKSLEFHYGDENLQPSWYEIHLAPYMDGVLLNGRDITSFKQTEIELVRTVELLNLRNTENERTLAELTKSNEQLRQITHVASHDLQEPLRKLQLFTSRITDNPTGQVSGRELERIKEAAMRMSNLLLAITRYTHLVMSSMQIQIVDLDMLMKQVLSELRSVITQKDATLHIDELPLINCDPFQISRLFFNLIDNSLKFTRRKPVISITCEKVEEKEINLGLKNFIYYKFTFSDNGIGFKNEYSKKIFEIFEKLHQHGDYPGVGIGLPKCQRIVENHHGQITAYSSPNEGATFVIYLPANLPLHSAETTSFIQEKRLSTS